MLRVRTDGQRLPTSVGIDESYRHKIGIGHGRRVGYCERIFVDWLDGAPDVDDLVACLQKLFGFFWEVVRDSGFGRRVRLVNMHAVDGTAEVGGCLAGVYLWAADSMVEDEDT